MNSPLIGVTVLPEYFQCETVDAVLDNLVRRAGVTAVATSPYVMAPADEATGGREPPIDAGAGKVRLLDRPLWGKRELWVRTAPSFSPNRSHYETLRYQPPTPNELSREGKVIDAAIEGAKQRGLEIYFQVQAAIPPGYRVQFGGPQDDDLPRMPDGSPPRNRVASNASLASPHVMAYQRALIRDLHEAYPDIDGIRFDWPEYPPYRLDSMFVDFSEHARRWATQHDVSEDRFEWMRSDAAALYRKWHGGLTNDDLDAVLSADSGRAAMLQWAADFPGVAAMLQFKAKLSHSLLTGLRETMDDVSSGRWKLAPSAFPPPWSLISGMDFRKAATRCHSISVKLYGMHWAMMLRFYGEQILAANASLDETLLTRALARLLDIADDGGFDSLEQYHYPEPHERHPIGRDAQIRKIQAAQRDAGDMPVHVLAHGYGPADDFAARVATARDAGPHGLWVNRYGYLSDEKLDALGAVS